MANWNARILGAYNALKEARNGGDKLTIDLAEAALNSIMDTAAGVTPVTGNKGGK